PAPPCPFPRMRDRSPAAGRRLMLARDPKAMSCQFQPFLRRRFETVQTASAPAPPVIVVFNTADAPSLDPVKRPPSRRTRSRVHAPPGFAAVRLPMDTLRRLATRPHPL